MLDDVDGGQFGYAAVADSKTAPALADGTGMDHLPSIEADDRYHRGSSSCGIGSGEQSLGGRPGYMRASVIF